MAGLGLRNLGDLLRRALADYAPACVSALRSEVDDVVSLLDDIEIVLDYDDRIALIYQAIEHVKQFIDIRKMKSRGRLIEYV